jgi:hypothetical protein
VNPLHIFTILFFHIIKVKKVKLSLCLIN